MAASASPEGQADSKHLTMSEPLVSQIQEKSWSPSAHLASLETEATQDKRQAGGVATTTLARARDMAIVEAVVNFIIKTFRSSLNYIIF